MGSVVISSDVTVIGHGAREGMILLMKNVVTRALCATVLAVGLASGPVGAQAQGDHHAATKVSGLPTITIHSYMYTVPKSVPPGSKVKVVNQDGVPHTVSSSIDHGATFSVHVPPGETRRFIAPKKGSYAFFCKIHHSMTALLVVK